MLEQHIATELTTALKAHDAVKLSVFRMLRAAIHNREIENRSRGGASGEAELSEEEVRRVIRAELKKRMDAIAAYATGGRPDRARGEQAEADILAALLPEPLSDAAVEKIVLEGKVALGVSSLKEFGKLMAWVMRQTGEQASGERVSELVKKHLAGS